MSLDSQHKQFLRLFLECEPRLFAFIRSLLPSKTDAEEVLQETALVLWEKFDQFEAGTHFDRWAFRVAHYQIMYYRQKKARDRLYFDDTLIEKLANDMIEESSRIETLQRALFHCIDKLPVRDREIIKRRYRPGGTNREVANATGRSESAISRALNRIYSNLLRCIENALEHQPLPLS